MARNAANALAKSSNSDAARSPISHYIVTKDGKPCALFAVLAKQRAGILLPSKFAETFTKRRTANAAIKRSEHAAHQLRTSMLRDWITSKDDNARALIAQGTFTIVPVRSK